MSPETFLEWERKQSMKYEYADGQVIEMQGASPNHNRILANLIGNIYPYLKDKPCDIFPSDLRTYVSSKESYFYPDASIVCGDHDFSDAIGDTQTNPSVIFEILSPSTEDYDLGRKYFFYMQILSLKEYITIDSVRLQVISRKLQMNSGWLIEAYSATDDRVPIYTIDFDISVADIYSGIKR